MTFPKIAIADDNYRWVSDGEIGTLWHTVRQPHRHDSAQTLCGATLDAKFLARLIELPRACRGCLIEIQKLVAR
jgi:hypothetical protein